MGLGDEILALGRAEALFEKTGEPVSIVNDLMQPREHNAWEGNPAWKKNSRQTIMDGAGCRPYIKHWKHRQAVYNLDYKPRAGKIWLTDAEKESCTIEGAFVVVAPNIKKGASVNKGWGEGKFEKLIEDLDIPVYQLVADKNERVISGALPFFTPHFRNAAAAILKSSFVIANEGGSHHMAASMGKPALVIFGAFIPPSVTGYDFHENISIETPEGYCGRWDRCPHCEAAMKQITPELAKKHLIKLRERHNV